ncbi:MAG: lipoprotein-releasing ABC transporter ATP-binding protein LolD [Gammaproteobacteria bacterium]|nr:lipoprotein-releasing ABC transporter ATP-binding protein LolD [Gammaproteobacteria bacterium]
MNPILQCKNLTKTFADGKRKVPVLKGIDLIVEENSLIAIVGVSGSGKSTLLHLLGGLDKPTSGDVFWVGKNIKKLSEHKKCQLRNRYLGFIYQFHHLLPEFNAIENVAMPLLIGGMDIREAKNRAIEFLDHVGLQNRALHKPSELSGGERQRVAIARALVTHPQCVLADEPTGNLDQKTAEQVFQLMLDLQKQFKISFIMVTHNLVLSQKMQVCYALEEGRILVG